MTVFSIYTICQTADNCSNSIICYCTNINPKHGTISVKPVEDRIEDRKSYIDHAVRFYCTKKHGGDLCSECKELLDYAMDRIDSCPNNLSGIRCKGCPTRCYSSKMSERMKDVLSFTAPHMFFQRDLRKRFRQS
jgi:hypothetical protein